MFTLAKQEKTALFAISLVILICIFGTLLLDGMGKESFSKQYVPGLSDGTLVTLSGVIGKVTEVGGNSILEVSGITVFIPVSAGMSRVLHEGSQVRLTGMVQHYKGEEEILVSDSSDFILVSGYQVKDQHSGQSESEFQD
jgi:hypothetical protein